MLTAMDMLHPVAVILIVTREFFISAFRLVAVEKGVVIAASGLGKAKTVSQFIAITLTLLQAPIRGLLGGFPPGYGNYVDICAAHDHFRGGLCG